MVNTIYADFEKVFDKVPHHLLLKKLHSYNLNVHVIQWIRSFLCYRKQRVKINGCYSEWTDVISGIPQGTILGPILFIIYINDLPEICEEFARIYLFADDAKLFKHISCNEDHKALQLGLKALQDWSNTWLLKLNILKCKTVFFGRNINKNYRDVPDIRFRFLLAGYPAFFFYPVPAPVPAKMVPGTGYLYRIVLSR